MSNPSKEELEKGQEYLNKLREKYDVIGQDFFDYLEGLVQSNGLKYWDYIHVDALLGLQKPRTNFADEVIFITYHQICELYFKLVKHELNQLTEPKEKEYNAAKNWIKRLSRVNNYFKHLCSSFDIMKSGMDPYEFRQFRMALLPASGFQAVQFRHMEIMSTDLDSLISPQDRKGSDASIRDRYDKIYWKSGGIDMETQKKTLTLKEFEAHYDEDLLDLLEAYVHRNLNYLFLRSNDDIQENPEIITLLKTFDRLFNVYWKMSHLMASSRHLPSDDQGTGGTNWRKYLPPKFQKIMFFETLWSDEEKNDWGKAGVLKAFKKNVESSWLKPAE